MRFSRFFTETTQNFNRMYLWNYNSYGPVIWLIWSTISIETFYSGHFFSYLQPFVRYLKISAPASRAKNRVTYMSYRSQRVNTEVWKISNCSKMCFFISFWDKNEIFGEIWWFFEKNFEILGHVNPLKTIRFWDLRVFLLRQRETLTACIFGTTIAMDL